MKIIKTLKHKIINHTKIFDQTITKYNDALSFIINVVNQEFDHIKDLSIKEMLPVIEKLIHATKHNPLPKYKDFDVLFYKFPVILEEVL